MYPSRISHASNNHTFSLNIQNTKTNVAFPPLARSLLGYLFKAMQACLGKGAGTGIFPHQTLVLVQTNMEFSACEMGFASVPGYEDNSLEGLQFLYNSTWKGFKVPHLS